MLCICTTVVLEKRKIFETFDMFFVILILKSKSKVLDNLKINIHQHKQKMHEDSLGLPRKSHKYSVNYLA